MKRKDAEKIIKTEQLISYSFFEDRGDATDEMVIKKVSDKWIVYATNERASKIISGEHIYDNEEEALDNHIIEGSRMVFDDNKYKVWLIL